MKARYRSLNTRLACCSRRDEEVVRDAPFLHLESQPAFLLKRKLIYQVSRCNTRCTGSGVTGSFSFKDLDENKLAGSIRIRIETIDYFLKRYREDIIKRRKLEQDIDAQLAQYEAQLRRSMPQTEHVAAD